MNQVKETFNYIDNFLDSKSSDELLSEWSIAKDALMLAEEEFKTAEAKLRQARHNIGNMEQIMLYTHKLKNK